MKQIDGSACPCLSFISEKNEWKGEKCSSQLASETETAA